MGAENSKRRGEDPSGSLGDMAKMTSVGSDSVDEGENHNDVDCKESKKRGPPA